VVEKGVSPQEERFVKHRRAHVRTHLRRVLGEEVAEEDVPAISLCMGGGGVRAMIYTLGAIRALARMGVLDLVTWSASLSGAQTLMPSLVQLQTDHSKVLVVT
jgi:hypothetical protein